MEHSLTLIKAMIVSRPEETMEILLTRKKMPLLML